MRRTAGLLLLLGGCVEQVPLGSPIPPGSALLLFAPLEASVSVLAVEDSATLPAFIVQDGDTVFLLTLDGTLEDRGLRAGALSLVSEGRRLPEARATHRLIGPGREWEPIENLPPELAALRIAELADCSGTSCRRFDTDRLVCETPCPEISPVASPHEVEAPRPSSITCPVGWTETASTGPGCSPPPRISCPDGAWQPLDAAACQPLRACPGTPFRRPDAANLAFVDPSSGSGGDGTEASPFGSVAEALSRVVLPATLTLAAGRHRLPATLPDGLTLVGTCPSEVFVDDTVRPAAGGGIALEALTLAHSEVAISVEDGTVVGAGIEARSLAETTGAGELRLRETRLRMGVRTGPRASGRIVLDEVSVDGLNAISGQGQLEARKTTFAVSSSSILILDEDSQATLDTVWLRSASSRSPALSLTGRAAVSGRALFAETPHFSAATDASTLALDNSGIAGLRLAATVGEDAQWSGRHTRLRGFGGTTLISVAARGRLTLEGVDIEVGEAMRTLQADQEADIVVTDLRARGGSALLRLRGTSQARLTRVHTSGGIEAGPMTGGGLLAQSYTGGRNPCRVLGLSSEPNRVRLEVSDLRVDGVPTGAGFALCPGTVATLRNVAVTGAEIGIYAECRDSCDTPARVTDVNIEDLIIDGAPSSESGIFQRGGQLRLRRGEIRDVADYGIYGWGSAVDLADVLIEDVGAAWVDTIAETPGFCSQSQTGTFRAPASAIFIETWEGPLAFIRPERLQLERFRLRRAACSALTTGFDGSFDARDGALRDNRRGINLIRDFGPTLAPNVVFGANMVDIFRIL